VVQAGCRCVDQGGAGHGRRGFRPKRWNLGRDDQNGPGKERALGGRPRGKVRGWPSISLAGWRSPAKAVERPRRVQPDRRLQLPCSPVAIWSALPEARPPGRASRPSSRRFGRRWRSSARRVRGAAKLVEAPGSVHIADRGFQPGAGAAAATGSGRVVGTRRSWRYLSVAQRTQDA